MLIFLERAFPTSGREHGLHRAASPTKNLVRRIPAPLKRRKFEALLLEQSSYPKWGGSTLLKPCHLLLETKTYPAEPLQQEIGKCASIFFEGKPPAACYTG